MTAIDDLVREDIARYRAQQQERRDRQAREPLRSYNIHKAGLSAPRVAEALGCGLRTVFRLKQAAPQLWVREPTPVRPGRGTPQPRLPADALPVLRAMLAERASRDNIAKARQVLALRRLTKRATQCAKDGA